MTRASLFVLSIGLMAMSLAMSGCGITIKYFLLPDEQQGVVVFAGHELEPMIETSVYDDDANRFLITICQRQPAPPDSADVASLPYVRLEDLSVVIDPDVEPERPAMRPTDLTWRSALEGDFVHGPMFHWHWVRILDDYQQIEIRFTAVLVDGSSGEEIERKAVRHVLYRKHDRVPSWQK